MKSQARNCRLLILGSAISCGKEGIEKKKGRSKRRKRKVQEAKRQDRNTAASLWNCRAPALGCLGPSFGQQRGNISACPVVPGIWRALQNSMRGNLHAAPKPRTCRHEHSLAMLRPGWGVAGHGNGREMMVLEPTGGYFGGKCIACLALRSLIKGAASDMHLASKGGHPSVR